MLAVCWYLIQCGFFTEVYQKFLCSGHNFLLCRNDFALIKKRKKVSSIMATPKKHRYPSIFEGNSFNETVCKVNICKSNMAFPVLYM
jgi:hypothetical protein